MTAETVRHLRPDEVDAAAEMLARAFVGRPFPSLLGDDAETRFAASRWTFAGLTRYALSYGEAWTTNDLAAVAVWWAPEYVGVTEARAQETGLADAPSVIGPAAWARVEAYDAVATEIHHRSMTGPHWYLCVIGTDPAAQGQGLASQLLNVMFARLDQEQLPAYLDTNVAENVAYYTRRGFRLTAQATDPASGILVRGMRRDPRPTIGG